MSNNFVGMQKCPYCKECMGVVIQQQLKDIPQEVCTGPEPCDKCNAKFKAEGIVPVWEVSNPGQRKPKFTGRYAFFRREVIQSEALIDMMEHVGFLFCDTATMDSVFKQMTN